METYKTTIGLQRAIEDIQASGKKVRRYNGYIGGRNAYWIGNSIYTDQELVNQYQQIINH